MSVGVYIIVLLCASGVGIFALVKFLSSHAGRVVCTSCLHHYEEDRPMSTPIHIWAMRPRNTEHMCRVGMSGSPDYVVGKRVEDDEPVLCLAKNMDGLCKDFKQNGN